MRKIILSLSEKLFHIFYCISFVICGLMAYTTLSSVGWRYGWKLAMVEFFGELTLIILFGVLFYGIFEIIELLRQLNGQKKVTNSVDEY